MSKDAQRLIADIERLLRAADAANLPKVALHLNAALIEAGSPGIPPPDVSSNQKPADLGHH